MEINHYTSEDNNGGSDATVTVNPEYQVNRFQLGTLTLSLDCDHAENSGPSQIRLSERDQVTGEDTVLYQRDLVSRDDEDQLKREELEDVLHSYTYQQNQQLKTFKQETLRRLGLEADHHAE